MTAAEADPGASTSRRRRREPPSRREPLSRREPAGRNQPPGPPDLDVGILITIRDRKSVV